MVLLEFAEHRGVQSAVRDLNRIYREQPALWTRDAEGGGFSWIDANDSGNNTFSFIRHGDDGSSLVCVTNFAGVPHDNYRIGLPAAGRWDEVLNTDAEIYGGSGVGNMGAITAEDHPHHGLPASAAIRVPPLGSLWFAPGSVPAT